MKFKQKYFKKQQDLISHIMTYEKCPLIYDAVETSKMEADL